MPRSSTTDERRPEPTIDGDTVDPPDDERGSEVDDYTGADPARRRRPDARVDASTTRSRPASATATSPTSTTTTSTPIVGDDSTAPMSMCRRCSPSATSSRSMAQRMQADFENFRKRSAAQSLGRGRPGDRSARRSAAAGARRGRGGVRAASRRGRAAAEPDAGRAEEARPRGARPRGPAVRSRSRRSGRARAGRGGDVVVAEVLRSGYRWKGKTLRPAMVKTKD